MYDEFIADVVARSGRQVEFARLGTLELAGDESDAAHLSAHVDRLREIGVASEWIDAGDLPRVESAVAATGLAGGVLTPSQAFVRVGDLIGALSHAARLAGAVTSTPVEVVEVSRRRGGGVSARCSDGTAIDADIAVVCAGSWTGRLRVSNAGRLPVRPVRGQLLALRWAESRRRPAHIVWGREAYCVPWSDGTLLIGATMEEVGYDERSTVEGVSSLLEGAVRLLPEARRAELTDVRVGLRPAAPDGLPIVGPLRDDPSIVVATAHFRNGILLAPLTAAAVARFVCEGVRDDLLDIANPDRFHRR
jgi:glycine oxidase